MIHTSPAPVQGTDLSSGTMGAVMALLACNAHETIAAQNRRIADLERESLRDIETGFLTPRGFFEAFEREIARAARGAVPGGVLVLIEIDNAESLLDSYGAECLQAVSLLVARSLDSQVRKMDVIGRTHGHGFVVLLSGAESGDAARRAHVLGWQMNNLSLIWRGTEIPVLVSMGLKHYSGSDNPEHIFNAADSTLCAHRESTFRERRNTMNQEDMEFSS